MTTLSPMLFADLMTKPFALGARGPSAYDCVGLAAELQRRLGRKLPAYLSHPEELHRQLAVGGILDECHRIAEPVAGAIALVRMAGGDRHIGTMVSPYRILHTTEQTGSPVVEAISSPLWHRRILGFYLPPESVR